MKVKSITILGRKWRDKVNGNTYHSARVFADGKLVAVVPFQYGYGRQFEWNAAIELDKALIFTGKKRLQKNESPWRWIKDRLGCAYLVDCTECTKRECVEFGQP